MNFRLPAMMHGCIVTDFAFGMQIYIKKPNFVCCDRLFWLFYHCCKRKKDFSHVKSDFWLTFAPK